jgi:hypothetical protein
MVMPFSIIIASSKHQSTLIFNEFQDREAAAPVLFEKPGDSLLLGTFTLEALGLTLDPLQRQLHKAILRL